MMEDDNLATILCSYFDNPDQEQNDETGWSEDAERGCDEVTQAIRDHFRPLADRIEALSAEVERLRKALVDHTVTANTVDDSRTAFQ